MNHGRTGPDGVNQSVVAPVPGTLANASWPADFKKSEKRTVIVAPPPVWTRYIDSRLKQFPAH